jgi:multiple sugar transport system substrate-binding protein
MKTRHRTIAMAALIAVVLPCLAAAPAARAADFNWKKYQGQTVSFLADNNPLGNAIANNKAAFEKLTGMTLKVDTYQEQQMRQRLVTVLNARSDEVDVFMTLVSREGAQFAKAGWYGDLQKFTADAAPDYDFAGFSPALLKAATIGGKLTSIPMNIEGPVLYYRRDIFKKCGVAVPESIDDLLPAAKKIKACDPQITPFVSRGLKDALAYTFSNFVHNMGGSYMKGGKADLCSAPDLKAMNLYGTLLKDYGPPGVVNYSFYQIDAIYRAGRAAMAFESQNELANMIEGGARDKDTGIMVLPPGAGGSVPTAIGWGLSMSPFSKKQGPAWYLIQWATSPAMQAKIELSGVAAPRAAIGEDPSVQAWLKALPIRGEWQAAVNQIAARGSSEVGFPIVANPESRSFMGQAVDDVLLGTKPASQACAEADTGIDALVAGGG